MKDVRRILWTILVAGSLAVPVSAAEPARTDGMNDTSRVLYAIGVNLADSLRIFEFSDAEFQQVLKGFVETQKGVRPGFDVQGENQRIQALARERRMKAGARQAGKGKEFLEAAAREKGAVKTESGMVYISLKEGAGDSPRGTDTVLVHYRGTLIDGKEFDSSYKRGKPLEFRLDAVIKCWTEGVQRMKPGGKARMVCPPNLAYGDAGVGETILPGATLNFEVELLEVKGAAQGKPGSVK